MNPVGAPPDDIGLDGVFARMQLSAYAAVTGAFERYPTVLGGARELGLVACVVLLAALVALARSLGVRPLAAAAGLGSLALCPPAMAALTTFGPGLLGAAWLTAGAALLARGRTWLWILGAPAVLLGIASAPVLAVLVLVISAAVVVTVRVRRRGPSLLGVAVLAAALPLALLPPPGGAAAVPALVALVVLVGLVLLDEAVTRLSSRSAVVRRGGLAALAAVPAVALVVVLVPAPRTVADAVGAIDGAPALATWLVEATDPATGVAAAPGVWSDLLRGGVPVARLQPDGALSVTVGAGSGPVVSRFGEGRAALEVSRARPEGEAPAGTAGRAATALADNPNLAAPDDVRACCGPELWTRARSRCSSASPRADRSSSSTCRSCPARTPPHLGTGSSSRTRTRRPRPGWPPRRRRTRRWCRSRSPRSPSRGRCRPEASPGRGRPVCRPAHREDGRVRIAMVQGRADPERDGVADYVRHLTAALRDAGENVLPVPVLGPREAAERLKSLRPDIVHVQFAPSAFGFSARPGLLPDMARQPALRHHPARVRLVVVAALAARGDVAAAGARPAVGPRDLAVRPAQQRRAHHERRPLARAAGAVRPHGRAGTARTERP